MLPKNFSGSNIRSFDPYKYPKKAFLEFFSSISRGLCTGNKCEKLDFLDLLPAGEVKN